MESNKRLLSLDVFRGLTIAAMILVNNPGNWNEIYHPLRHSDWHGCTFTDLVFPFFLFSVGVSMAYSLKNSMVKGNSFLVKKILRRVAVIFMLGIFICAFPLNYLFPTVSIWGVLQSIAIAYGIAAILCLNLNSIKLCFASFLILALYWVFMLYGGQGDIYSADTNAIALLESKIFGEGNLLFGWANVGGFFTILPMVVNVLTGYLIGKFIQKSKNLRNSCYIIFFIGLSFMYLGQFWGNFYPINKSMWTSSYVVYASGWAAMIFAFLLWLIDVNGCKSWAYPYKTYGMNPLFIYFIAQIWCMIGTTNLNVLANAHHSIYNWGYQTVFVPIAGELNGSLLFALWHVVLFWLISFIMYKKKIFIKI